jgi:hypothetical protein
VTGLDSVVTAAIGGTLGFFASFPISLALLSLTQKLPRGYKGYSFPSQGPAKDTTTGIIVWVVLWGPIIAGLLFAPILYYRTNQVGVIAYDISLIGTLGYCYN